MAEVFGFLREEKATHGEKQVYRRLKDNLPKEFAVYVECPLHDKRQLRYPDFIVSTNYGVVVLEVKDWVTVDNANKFGAFIRDRNNQERREKNPVTEAREKAILLSNELKQVATKTASRPCQDIPWGYAVVLPNLPASTITRLRVAWGEEFVLNLDDLAPDIATARLKATLPVDKIRPLQREELDLIRATINPMVFIERQDRPTVILDAEQEKIVVEPPTRTKTPTKPVSQAGAIQEELFEEVARKEKEKAASDVISALGENTAIRLVRGVAGSGKTLVLTQRARYLAAQYPEWQIIVLTYNNELSQSLAADLKGFRNVKVSTFHHLCRLLIESGNFPWVDPVNPIGWLRDKRREFSIIDDLSPEFLDEEITWIKETGVHNLPMYLEIERKGRGGEKRLGGEQRRQIYKVLLAYQRYLKEQKLLDWADIPYIVLRGLAEGKIQSPGYSAILIDEAQDFAPVWIRVVSKVLSPEAGVLFLSDDPNQSIYRFYSWREKGIEVVGRTRHLKLPYRNTFEIYRAAYSIVKEDMVLQSALESEGQVIVPEIDSHLMRHGERPLLQRCASFEAETSLIREKVRGLLLQGIDGGQIAVLHRRRAGVKKLETALKGLDVHITTFHACKGLEFEAVFISQLQETFTRLLDEPEAMSEERRLLYMALTRARQHLQLFYQGALPVPLTCLREHCDTI